MNNLHEITNALQGAQGASRRSMPSKCAPPAPIPARGSEGQPSPEAHPKGALAQSSGESRDAGHHGCETPIGGAGVDSIIVMWRARRRWHKAEKSLILQAKATCRSFTDGDKDAANALFDRIAKTGEGPDDLLMVLDPFLRSITVFRERREQHEKFLRKAAKALPVWPWVESVKGFGPLNLAAIVGECGDIGSYRSVSAFWKRMGLAVIEGERQRRVAGDADLALVHGYNAERRAVAYLLGDCLVKANGAGPYRQAYDERKAYEAERVATKAHAHNRAARYMTKRVLRDLYSAWRRADGGGHWPIGIHVRHAPANHSPEGERHGHCTFGIQSHRAVTHSCPQGLGGAKKIASPGSLPPLPTDPLQGGRDGQVVGEAQVIGAVTHFNSGDLA